MKKMIALLLCAAMLLSLAACTTPVADPTDPTETTEAVLSAADIYAQAAAALDALTDVSMELLITTVITVDGDEFSQESTQTLTYQAKGTDDAVIAMDEEIMFSVHSTEDEDEEAQPLKYSEIWHQGTVYAELSEAYRYQGAVDAESAAGRYTPVVLLDAALYGSVTAEDATGGTLIHFAEPAAGESWIIPGDAQLQEASGTALVSADGKLTEMTYAITYTNGPSMVKTTVKAKPMATPNAVSAPAYPDRYTSIGYIDALRINATSLNFLMQTDSLTFSSMESLVSQAAGVVQNQSVQADMHGRREETQLKVDTSIYFMNYSTMESDEYDQEETFIDGKLTTVVNDGLPSTNTTVSWEDVRIYMAQQITAGMLDMSFWEDVTATDFGSVCLLEYELNDSFGNTLQNYICNMLWQDPSFLLNLSSKYENAEVSGYLSVDKYTGLPVATGYYYEGVHTIDGQEYIMTLQYDQSMESPSKGAYKEITDKTLPEEEPASKATPLLYKVTGENGQKMWLFGTIHVGDARTAYLPAEIRSAFEESDALALECNTELFDEQVEEDEELAQEVSDLYFYSSGEEVIKSLMEEEDYATALKLLKAVGGYNMNMPYAKPCVWSDSIEMFYLRQGYQLHRDQGLETRFMAWAEELDKEILEVESSMAQLKMLTGFSDDLQLWMLESTLESDAREYWEDTMDLYEKWCTGDEAALREVLANEWDTTEMTEEEVAKYTPLMEEYTKAMDFDRNEGMLDVAIEYLESGDVIFYAVGLAHLLDGTNGLVDALRAAGYTVEAVTYGN